MDFLKKGQSVPITDFQLGKTILVDKPQNWTSFDVVNKVRWVLRKKLGLKKFKVGHSGTLDPMATGLLIICTGKHTKKLTELTGLNKSYEGTIKFGCTTPSYDKETEEQNHKPTDHLSPELLENAKEQFVGSIQQQPPIFSALKVNGKRLYKSARAGEEVEIAFREVLVEKFDLFKFDFPEVDFSVSCGKGTYIRSLAHDLGQAVETGGHLVRLERTSVGAFHLDDAWNLDDFIEMVDNLPEKPKE